jgi:excisionase family DNA binding protein
MPALAPAPPGVRPRNVTVEVAAGLIGISRASVYTLIRERKLLSAKIGKRRLIPLTAIDEYLIAVFAEQNPDT